MSVSESVYVHARRQSQRHSAITHEKSPGSCLVAGAIMEDETVEMNVNVQMMGVVVHLFESTQLVKESH